MGNPASLELVVPSASPLQESQASRRHRSIFRSGATALLARGTALLVNFLLVPITVRYLGAEQYGLWITITTSVTMLAVLDFGVANSLTNLISKAYALNDQELAGRYFSTSFWIVTASSAALGVIALFLWPHIPWGNIFHVSNPALTHELAVGAMAALVIFLVGFPVGLVNRVMAGYQQLHLLNIFSVFGSLLGLMGVYETVQLNGTLPALVVAFALPPLAVNAGCLLWVCLYQMPWLKPAPALFTKSYVREIFQLSTKFFVTQIAGLIVFNTDNVIISHYLTPAAVTPYNVTWRLASYGSVIQTLFNPAMWAAYGEAYFRGDRAWISKTYRRVLSLSLGLLVLAAILLAIFGRALIRLWAGAPALPSASLLYLMCLWMILYGVSLNQSCLLGATGRLDKQVISCLLSAATNLSLSIYWVRSMGTTGVILATVLSYALFTIPFQSFDVRAILHKPWPSSKRKEDVGSEHAVGIELGSEELNTV